MVDFNAEPPPNVVRVPRWTLALHAVQFVFAIIILGLSAYGVSYVPYARLAFSIVVAICTMGVTIYLTASQLVAHKLYQGVVALAFHVWMLIFWIVDLGLVADLASIWSSPSCYTSYSYFYGYSSRCYYKRALEARGALEKRDTTVGAYYGALAAGAVFAAVQLVTWALSAVILLIHFNKHRSTDNTTTTTTTAAAQHLPPQYAPADTNTGAGVEKYNYQATPQPNATYPPTPQTQYAQPAYPQQQQSQQQQQQHQFTPPYAQDPIPRQDTVSPMSHAGQGGNPNASELSSPHHTGGAGDVVFPHNVSELSTPPQQSEQQQHHHHQHHEDLPELSNSK
ncbi:hypothetical protein DM02DRAFT_667473 [Periconia macrospinosa]|uniref:MARVEL domain-containing protein n=1 Tax=Periconia macrospinosa TaxID=97972 RepID=A0A2V1EAC1_9PLEO|nr:hypothetical protein DM02DRAFT_667473 [Periconia macrospinosa]